MPIRLSKRHWGRFVAHPPETWFSCPFLHISSSLTCLPHPFKLLPAGLACPVQKSRTWRGSNTSSAAYKKVFQRLECGYFLPCYAPLRTISFFATTLHCSEIVFAWFKLRRKRTTCIGSSLIRRNLHNSWPSFVMLYARLPFSMPFEWVGNLCGLLTMYLFSVANLTTLSHFTSFTRCRGNEAARALFLRCPSKGYITSPSHRVSMSRWTCTREPYAISIQPGQTQPCPVLCLCLCCSWPSSPWCFPLLMEQHSRKGALSFSAIQVTFLALALPTMHLHRLWTALH